MDEQKLKEEILHVMDQNHTGTLATVKKQKPHSRYMTFSHEDLTLYTPTSKETYKVDEIKENPNAHILLGYNGNGWGDQYIEFQGKVSLNDSKNLKEKLWSDELKNYFSSPDDPNYVVLQCQPETIRLMNNNSESSQTLELS
ncbi:pyridoxamine 5'-phosphate oxidase family protein [Bacillus taeanensis]|uniref:General stress protein n=1 Tax=Bacillus taeanensis TaxID=273032 RepID=A0A366XRJ8_9BACI|nr:pyridoxamine 5'-phosphate oxidase family protein [Bacillus taeanensis]RBW68158.1 general stress protein [Bacillus taeanensis]